MEGLLINSEIMIEQKEDYDQTKKVNNLAFNQTNGGILASRLRETDNFIPELSLVAEFQNKPIGHILFYLLDILSREKDLKFFR
jgi:putative acetyltransferase